MKKAKGEMKQVSYDDNYFIIGILLHNFWKESKNISCIRP